MLSADEPWELLARHLAGEGTPADEAAVRAWVAARPENLSLLLDSARTWEQAALGQPLAVGASTALASEFVFNPADLDRAWQRFETNVLGPPPAASPGSAPASPAPPGPPPLVPPAAPVGWVAGLLKTASLLVVGVGAGWWLNSASQQPGNSASPVVAQADSTAPRAPDSTARPAPPLVAQPIAADSLRPGQSADLIFDNTPVAEVARTLERTFVETRVLVPDSALASCRFTGSFHPAQPAAVLRVVSVATSATLTHRPDGSWELRGPGCK